MVKSTINFIIKKINANLNNKILFQICNFCFYIFIFFFVILYFEKFIFLDSIKCFSINYNKFVIPKLKIYFIGNNFHPIYVYGDFSENYVNNICIKIANMNVDNYSFHINKFNDKFNNLILGKSVFNHPNIIIDSFYSIDPNIKIILSTSHKNYNGDFSYLHDADFLGNEKKPQFINNSFHIYQTDLFLERYQSNIYNIDLNMESKINKQIKLVKQFYAIKNF